MTPNIPGLERRPMPCALRGVQDLGLDGLEQAARSHAGKYLYAARACRDFGDGVVVVLLPVYLTAMGLGALEVGVVATLALFGSALMTLGIGLLGSRIDQRKLLIAASGLMIATGLAFAASNTYAIVLLVAFVGTINPSSGSVSVFVPLEHAVLSRSVADHDRTAMFARYSLIGALAAAVGALAAGSADVLETAGISHLTALKAMFVAYALLGVAGALMYMRLPTEMPPTEKKPSAALGPSRGIVYKLAALFSVDAFAGGFAVQSLARLVALQQVRPVAVRRRRVLLLVRRLCRLLVSGRCLVVAAHRAGEHDGFYPHSLKPVSDPRCGST